MSNPEEPDRSVSGGQAIPIDWRKTVKFFLILTSPVTLLALYMLGGRLLLIFFWDYGN